MEEKHESFKQMPSDFAICVIAAPLYLRPKPSIQRVSLQNSLNKSVIISGMIESLFSHLTLYVVCAPI